MTLLFTITNSASKTPLTKAQADGRADFCSDLTAALLSTLGGNTLLTDASLSDDLTNPNIRTGTLTIDRHNGTYNKQDFTVVFDATEKTVHFVLSDMLHHPRNTFFPISSEQIALYRQTYSSLDATIDHTMPITVLTNSKTRSAALKKLTTQIAADFAELGRIAPELRPKSQSKTHTTTALPKNMAPALADTISGIIEPALTRALGPAFNAMKTTISPVSTEKHGPSAILRYALKTKSGNIFQPAILFYTTGNKTAQFLTIEIPVLSGVRNIRTDTTFSILRQFGEKHKTSGMLPGNSVITASFPLHDLLSTSAANNLASKIVSLADTTILDIAEIIPQISTRSTAAETSSGSTKERYEFDITGTIQPISITIDTQKKFAKFVLENARTKNNNEPDQRRTILAFENEKDSPLAALLPILRKIISTGESGQITLTVQARPTTGALYAVSIAA